MSEKSAVPPSEISLSKAKKEVLVVEDDYFYANIYRAKLAREGYGAEVVADGEQALKAVREKKPDLILLDLIMPVKDGFETLKELKADPNFKDIKVVVLSNLGQGEDVQRAKDLGAVDYLIKTNVSLQEVVDKIKKYLT
jgi:CheY-like chemotaxis protein